MVWKQILFIVDIEMLRKICLTMPGATEEVKWEADLCFCIGGKVFCFTGFDPHSAVTIKVAEDRFEEMTVRPGFHPAPYLARARWIMVEDVDLVSPQEWTGLLTRSYELIKNKLPKKTIRELGL